MDERDKGGKLRYVIYARKSTESVEKQVRSIGDQVADCQKLAAELGLNVVGAPITETKSAKTPGSKAKVYPTYAGYYSKKS